MLSRRHFLTTVTAGLGASAVTPLRAAFAQDDIKTALSAPVGLQMWSLREYLPKDLAGSLAKIRAMGFREVEGAGLWKHALADVRAALDAAGLRCQSAHMDFNRLRDDQAGAFAEAKAMGASTIVCPWIPHGKAGFTADDAATSAELFNRIGRAAKEAGLRFAYHLHGYEFVPSSDGTLFDTLMKATDPALVWLQVDVFHAFLGGADPAALIDRYRTRVISLHLKDLKPGFPVKAGTAVAPPVADVPLGTGQLDMAAVLRAAARSPASMYYVEDESADPLTHIPQSVAFLKNFKS